MEDNRLNKDFFDRGPAIVAKELLGNYLVRNIDGKKIIGLITETEAYGDEEDMASHARFGPTKRSQLMFGPPGHLYVYMIYGIFNLTNIVCGPDNTPGAVLLRSAQITKGESFATDFISKHKFTKTNNRLATGPGKLSEAFAMFGVVNTNALS